MKQSNLILFIAAGAGLYLLTRKNGAGATAGAGAAGSLAQPMPTAANLSGGVSRSDGTAAVRGDYNVSTGYRTFPPPNLAPPVLVSGGEAGTVGGVATMTTLPASRVMGPSDVERFFDGLTTRGFGDVFGGEVRHPLLDGKTPCEAIGAMNAYAAARHPDHPEWRWTTGDIPSPYNLWVC